MTRVCRLAGVGGGKEGREEEGGRRGKQCGCKHVAIVIWSCRDMTGSI